MSNTKKGSGKKLRAIVGSKGNGSKNLLQNVQGQGWPYIGLAFMGWI